MERPEGRNDIIDAVPSRDRKRPAWLACETETGPRTRIRRGLTVDEVASHLRGETTYGLTHGDTTSIAVIDIDAKWVEDDEPARERLDLLVASLRALGCDPLISSSPSGGYYLYMTTEEHVPRGVLGAWLHRHVKASLGSTKGVDLRPPRTGGSVGIRLPVGLGYSQRTRELVECRLLDDDLLPIHGDRESDVEALPDLLEAARLPLAALSHDESGAQPSKAAPATATRERREHAPRAYVPRDSEAGTIQPEELSGRSWRTTVARLWAGDLLDGSEGLYRSVRALAFERYVTRAQDATSVTADLVAWAEAHGHPPTEIVGIVRRCLTEFDELAERGELKRGLRKTEQIVGVDGRPSEIVPRLLSEPKVIEAIVANIDNTRVQAAARAILEGLRQYGTLTQARLEKLDGCTGRVIVAASQSPAALAANPNPERRVKASLAVVAREELQRRGYVRKLANHSTHGTRRSAVYGLDYAAVLALRRELGLAPIVGRSGQLVPCATAPVVVPAKERDVHSSGEIRARAITRQLLDPRTIDAIAGHAPRDSYIDAGELLAAIARSGSASAHRGHRSLLESLAPYVYLDEERGRVRISFAAVRDLRYRLGLPAPQVVCDGVSEADSDPPEIDDADGIEPLDHEIEPIFPADALPMRTKARRDRKPGMAVGRGR